MCILQQSQIPLEEAQASIRAAIYRSFSNFYRKIYFERIKKSLSQRVHKDNSGIVMHRDLFSAYLARYVNDDDCLSLQDARQEYQRSESILRSAWQVYQKNCERVGETESRLCHSSSEQFDLKLGNVSQIRHQRTKS